MSSRLWFGLFGGHLAWTAHLLGSYFAVSVGCQAGAPYDWTFALLRHAITLAAAAVAIAAGLAAYAVRRRVAPQLAAGAPLQDGVRAEDERCGEPGGDHRQQRQHRRPTPQRFEHRAYSASPRLRVSASPRPGYLPCTWRTKRTTVHRSSSDISWRNG